MVTAENHNKIGGLYSAVKECLDGEARVGYVAVEDAFGEVGPQDYLRTRFDLTWEHIARQVRETRKKPAGKNFAKSPASISRDPQDATGTKARK